MDYNCFIMTHKEKRTFFNWLQKQGALQHYKKNRHLFLIDSSRHLTLIPYTTLFLINAISAAFTQVNTEQGETYWSNLDTLWRNSEEFSQFFPL